MATEIRQDSTAAFDTICDLIAEGLPITGFLAARASGRQMKDYLKLKSWIQSKGYETAVYQGNLFYRRIKNETAMA